MKTLVVNYGNDIPDTVTLCLVKLQLDGGAEWSQARRRHVGLCGFHPDQYDFYDEPFDMSKVTAWINLEDV